MGFYEGFISEFVKSNYCYDEVSAKLIASIIRSEMLFSIVSEGSVVDLEKLISLDNLSADKFFKKNIDSLLNGIYRKCELEGSSVLNYLTNAITESTEEGEQGPFINHKNRKDGELFESTLAGILYSDYNDGNLIPDDSLVVNKLLSILIHDLIDSMKAWIKSDSQNSDFHKIVSKFLLSESSINKKYILELIETIAIEKFFDKVRNIGGLQGEDLVDYYGVNEEDLINLSIENREDVLVAIRSAAGNKNGAFMVLSREPGIPESVFSDSNLSKEIQTAKIFKKGSSDDVGFWVSIGIASIRVISDKFNGFIASNAAKAPAPGHIG